MSCNIPSQFGPQFVPYQVSGPKLPQPDPQPLLADENFSPGATDIGWPVGSGFDLAAASNEDGVLVDDTEGLADEPAGLVAGAFGGGAAATGASSGAALLGTSTDLLSMLQLLIAQLMVLARSVAAQAYAQPAQVTQQVPPAPPTVPGVPGSTGGAVAGASGSGPAQASAPVGQPSTTTQQTPPAQPAPTVPATPTQVRPSGAGGDEYRPPQVTVTGASSPAGASFAERASASLRTIGGIGTAELASYFGEVQSPAEQAALRASVATATTSRLGYLSEFATSLQGSGAVFENNLGKLRLDLKSVNDLRSVVGLPPIGLTGAGRDRMVGIITERLTAIEQQARSLVTSARAAGIPDRAGAEDLNTRAVRLLPLLGLIGGDATLRARIDAIPGITAGAVKIPVPQQQTS